MGVVLNNSTELHLDDVLGEVREGTDVPVYCGGPIGHDRLFFIHTLGSAIIPGAAEFAPGMFVGGDFAAVIDYVNSGYPTQGAVRFFLGYCGWSADQLRDEVNNDVWAVANGISVRPRKLLTLTGDAMWHTVVRALGPRYRLWNLHPVCTHAN